MVAFIAKSSSSTGGGTTTWAEHWESRQTKAFTAPKAIMEHKLLVLAESLNCLKICYTCYF